MKKKFALSAILLVFSIVLFAQGPDNENLRIIHGPYLQNLTSTSVSIMWVTNKTALPSVLLGEEGSEAVNYRNSKDGIIDGGATLHKVRINNLLPGTKYNYTPVSREILRYQPYKVYFGDTLARGNYSFSTLSPKAREVSFIVLNDIHEKSSLLAQYMKMSSIKEPDMVFLNGDIINYLQNEDQIYNGFLDTAVHYFAREIPFYLIRGNHESRGMKAREFKNFFDFEDDKFYSAVKHGPVHFIVLDCGEDKPDENRYYFDMADYDSYRLEELEWLKKHIKSKEFRNAPFKVVLVHMPILKGEEMGHGMQFLSDHFGPVLEEAGIDLLIAGHTHRVASYKANESGFGYPVIVSSNNTFLEIEVKDNQLRATLKDSEGSPVLESLIKK
jgi:predicted phosphodiesterase